jgi:hypothetical protein
LWRVFWFGGIARVGFSGEMGWLSAEIGGFGGFGGCFGYAAVGELVELGADIRWSLEFDADVEGCPHAVVAVENPWTIFGCSIQGVDT